MQMNRPYKEDIITQGMMHHYQTKEINRTSSIINLK